MYSESIFIYFSIILYPIDISRSTTALSVDSHRLNRDSGVQVHSYYLLREVFYYKSLVIYK